MRQILHLDLDAFFASVEVLLNPALQGKPLIVAMGSPEGRGVVATASYQARPFGVHSAMPLRQALRLCPQAVLVPVRHSLYSQYSRRVMALVRETSPLVEQVSIDEAYVEIPSDRDAAQSGPELQRRIQVELGLSATIALATNKLVSKIACNTVKPHGWLVVSPGQEAAFLAPLAIDRLPGAGKVTREKLSRWNVHTIGDLARVPVAELQQTFGKTGLYLHRAALGEDDAPIVTESKPRSLSQENTFDRDTRDVTLLEKELDGMSRGVARDLEHEGYLARTVALKLRYSDFTTMTRQETLRTPTANAAEIRDCAVRLLHTHWVRSRPVRLIGVGVHNLVDVSRPHQLELAFDSTVV